jgi:hypothetical protein
MRGYRVRLGLSWPSPKNDCQPGQQKSRAEDKLLRTNRTKKHTLNVFLKLPSKKAGTRSSLDILVRAVAHTF